LNQSMKYQKQKIATILTLLILGTKGVFCGQLKTYEIQSPDRSIELFVTVDNSISYSVTVDGKSIIEPSQIFMTIDNNRVLGKDPKVLDVKKHTVRQAIKPVIPEKFAGEVCRY